MTRDLRVKENLKIVLRAALRRRGVDVVRHPYMTRLATTLRWLQVESVVDVGANVGQYGSALRSVGYRGRICSCEPLADAFGHLERRAARDARWDALHVAVGSTPTEIEINVSANSYSSSLRPMTATHLRAAPDSRVVRQERVRVVTVADLMTERRLRPSASLLKVDTQGYESDVLDGAGTMLSEFAAVQLELSFVPLYESQWLFHALVQRMSDAGFELFGLEAGMADPSIGRLLQCDGLFVNAHRVDGDRTAGTDR